MELSAADGYTLRAWQATDLALVREASADPYIPLITTVPSPYDAAQAADFIEAQRARSGEGSGHPFVIEDADGRAVGNIGLWLRLYRVTGRASIGYWVVESGRGRGAAVAALTAVSRWAVGELGIARVELHIEPWNTGSLKAAEAAGFTCEGLMRSWQEVGGVRKDMYMYSLIAV